MAMTREQLHDILNSVPEDRFPDVKAALEPFADPVLLAFLNAAEDDEETMAEDLQASRQARRDLADLTAADRAAVEAAIRRLADDSSQGDFRKLRADRAGGFT